MPDTSAPAGAFPREDLYRAVYPGAEIREAPTGSGMPTLRGHFAIFNEWTHIDSAFEGRFMERIAPGAFKKTLKEGRGRIKVLFNHGKDPQIGDKVLGAIDTLREDSKGGTYEVPLFDTSYNRELVPGLKAGVYGASFRFNVLKEEVVQNPKRSSKNPDGLPERTITEAKVLEFGPVTFPAYDGATAGVRSLTDKFRPTTTVETTVHLDGREVASAVARHTEASEDLEALAPQEPAEDATSEETASRDQALDTDQADSRHLARPSRTEGLYVKPTTTGLDLYPKREEAPKWRL